MSGGTVWNSLVDSYDRRIPAPYAAMPGSETQRSRIANLTLFRFGTSGDQMGRVGSRCPVGGRQPQYRPSA